MLDRGRAGAGRNETGRIESCLKDVIVIAMIEDKRAVPSSETQRRGVKRTRASGGLVGRGADGQRADAVRIETDIGLAADRNRPSVGNGQRARYLTSTG